VRGFQILVETISFGNKLKYVRKVQKLKTGIEEQGSPSGGCYSLFPLSESRFFEFDLFRESLSEGFFFLLELGIIQFPDLGFAKFTRFHLLSTVRYKSSTT